MPEGVDFRDYFKLVHIATIEVDNSSRHPYKVIEETDEYITYCEKSNYTDLISFFFGKINSS